MESTLPASSMAVWPEIARVAPSILPVMAPAPARSGSLTRCAIESFVAAAIADDAGPRTSGLSLVHHVDARYVRLGSGFVEGLARNEQRRVALRAFQDNARRLERVTIASGIEEASGLAVLWHCGVDYAQGDYIQEPRPGLEYDFEASLA